MPPPWKILDPPQQTCPYQYSWYTLASGLLGWCPFGEMDFWINGKTTRRCSIESILVSTSMFIVAAWIKRPFPSSVSLCEKCESESLSLPSTDDLFSSDYCPLPSYLLGCKISPIQLRCHCYKVFRDPVDCSPVVNNPSSKIYAGKFYPNAFYPQTRLLLIKYRCWLTKWVPDVGVVY